MMILGFIETMDAHEFNNVKIFSAVKNIIRNVH
jgi:hypothetical protein